MSAEKDVPQVCTNRHHAGPCDHPLCACLAGHKTPHHDAQGRVLPPADAEPCEDCEQGVVCDEHRPAEPEKPVEENCSSCGHRRHRGRCNYLGMSCGCGRF